MDERAALSRIAELVSAAGDDAAVIDDLVFTIDMLHEETDFPTGTTNYTAGWRAVGASLSDVAAMGASAVGTVAVYGAPSFEPDDLEAFVGGTTDVSAAVGAEYVGGDLDTHEELTVATAAIGRTEDAIGRVGAEPGDVVCVTGTLGRTAAAVRAFEAGDVEAGNDLFRFHPRVDAGLAIASRATAMMDSSDGLARSLHQLGAASNVGFAVEGARIPIAEALDDRVTDEEILDVAVTYGEDFELVCTMAPEAVDAVASTLDVPLTVIGEVKDPTLGIELDGAPLADTGYTHGT